MPFTVNVGAYQGGQMLAQAGQNLGQGILGGVVNYMEGQKDLANDQVLLDFYSKQGMVTPDILDKYQRGSHSGKTGIIAGLTRQFAEQQQQAQEQRLTAAQAEIAKYHQAALANEATRIGIQQAQEAREKAAAEFTPRPPMQFATPPPGQTGIPYGPPTEAEAAAPKVTMIETSPGKWKEPEAAGGAAGSEKTLITLPDGRQVYVTGNEAARLATPNTKDLYGVNQAQFLDPTRTKRGNVSINKEGQAEFVPADDGTHMRINIHKNAQDQEVDNGIIPVEEYDQHVAKIRNTPVSPSAAAQQAAPAKTEVVAKTVNGVLHHYEVDHAAKKVVRQID